MFFLKGLWKLCIPFVAINVMCAFVFGTGLLVERSVEVKLKTLGLVPPVFTALNKDATINYDIIPSYAKFYVDHGINAVLVGGTTGEHVLLKVEDRKNLMDSWLEAGRAYNLSIMAQVGGAPLDNVLNMTRYYAANGASAILTLPQLYYTPTTVEDLVDYVEKVANEAKELPILYYHHPKKSNVLLPMPEFVRAAAARIPNFKGLKFASNDVTEAYNTLRVLKNGQEMFLGSGMPLSAAAFLGIKSFIGGPHSLFLDSVQDTISAVQCNDGDKARELEERMTMVLDAIDPKRSFRAIKAAMGILTGIDVGPPVPPNKPMSDQDKEKIRQNLLELGFITE